MLPSKLWIKSEKWERMSGNGIINVKLLTRYLNCHLNNSESITSWVTSCTTKTQWLNSIDGTLCKVFFPNIKRVNCKNQQGNSNTQSFWISNGHRDWQIFFHYLPVAMVKRGCCTEVDGCRFAGSYILPKDEMIKWEYLSVANKSSEQRSEQLNGAPRFPALDSRMFASIPHSVSMRTTALGGISC